MTTRGMAVAAALLAGVSAGAFAYWNDPISLGLAVAVGLLAIFLAMDSTS